MNWLTSRYVLAVAAVVLAVVLVFVFWPSPDPPTWAEYDRALAELKQLGERERGYGKAFEAGSISIDEYGYFLREIDYRADSLLLRHARALIYYEPRLEPAIKSAEAAMELRDKSGRDFFEHEPGGTQK